MKDDFRYRSSADDIEADERVYRYLHADMDEEERSAFEAEAVSRPDLLNRLVAWGRVRRTRLYLRMRSTPEGVRPELYLSPALNGYGMLELTSLSQRRRLAAGETRLTERAIYQITSDDSRLLLTLRRENLHRWQLSARYAPSGYWRAHGDQYVLVETPNEPQETPQCLLCLFMQNETGQILRRYAAWFLPDQETPDCYVARLRIPDWQGSATHLLFGVVDADARRWLTDEEREASIKAAVDEDARRRW